MRRFELGAESKFWELKLDGLTLRIHFGKIGSSGQTQIKKLASQEAADAEIDRLVKEKLKKGFVEVDGSGTGASTTATAAAPAPAAKKAKAAPTPSPTPTPTPTRSPSPTPARSPSPSPSPPLAEIDTASRVYQQAAPVPASGAKPKTRSVAETYAKARDRCVVYARELEAGANEAKGQMKELVQAVVRAYTTRPEELDVLTEAVAYRLLAPPRGYRDSHGGELFGRYWVAAGGGELALRALAMAGRFGRETGTTDAWREPSKLYPTETPDKELATWGQSDDVWVPIREWVATVDAAELGRLRALVGELREGLPIGTRALLDASLGDPVFCDEDATELVKAQQAALVLWPVLYSIDDPAKVEGHLDALAGGITATAIDRLPDLVVRLGVRAARSVARVLEGAQKGGYGTEQVRAAAAALALIRTPEVAAVMAKNLDGKDIRPIATEYLQNAPTLAVAPLAALAIGRGAGADLARSVLGAVVAKIPEEARALAEALPEAERRVTVAALERFENLVDADVSELPRVLASPPWLEKKRQLTARVVKGVAAAKHEAKVVWQSEAQHDDFKNERSYYAVDPKKEKATLKEIDDAQKAKRASSVGSYKLLTLPKESALRTLETAPLEIFSWYYSGVPHAFVGRYGLEAIPAVLRYATIDPTNAVEALAVVDSADVAPLMADALVRLKKSRQQAQAWLLRFPEAAAIGLIPAAVGEVGKGRAAAEAALRFLAAHEKSEVVREAAKAYGEEVSAALADVLEFDPLLEFPARLPKMPGFFSAGALPRPRLKNKKVLPVRAVEALGAMLSFSRLDEPYAGLEQVKEACEPGSLAELAWELFQAWLVAGAPSKEQWAFLALGHFGDDEAARKLTPLVRAWPGEAAHARAVIGLDVLAAIGTDVALMHLHGIAQKVKFKGLQERAREKIDQIAEARGLTAEELADRLVPDLGLEPDGSLMLDFGPRKFKVTFDETLKPAVLPDGGGKRLGDLPKPNKSDDAEKAAAAVATWKALKKDSKTVASGQLLRLELAMCSQRRWSQDVFDQFLVQHPLLIHIVRRLVWGAYDPKSNELRSSFRVVEDKSLADVKDARYKLPAGATVGIVHRLELGDADAAAWGQVLGDYEIMQPFAQLSRQAATPTEAEREGTAIERVAGLTVPTGKVLGLDHNGWRRGPPQDGGVVCWYEKPMGDGFVACLDLEPGIFTGMVSEAPEQKLGKVVVAKDADYWRRENTKKLGELSPIQFSELLRDLESLRP